MLSVSIILLQVIRTADTSNATFDELTNFAKAMKKTPVTYKVCQLDLVSMHRFIGLIII